MAIAPIAEYDTDALDKMNLVIAKANEVDGKATAEQLAAEAAARQAAILALPLPMPVQRRPGDAPIEFVQALPEGETMAAPVPDALLRYDDAGKVVRLAGDNLVAPRHLYALEPNRRYLATFVVQRRVNSPDPDNDAIRCALAWYGQGKGRLPDPAQTVVQDLTALTTGSGRQVVRAVVSRAAGADIDIVAPAGARYVRPYVQTFGTLVQSDVEVIGWDDVTDAVAFAPDVSALEDRVSAIESLDPGDRLANLEAQVTAPNEYRVATIGDLEAATVPVTADVVEVLGYHQAADRGGHRRVAVAVGDVQVGDRQSLDGRWWAVRNPRPTPYNFGATGEGDDVVADTDALLKLNAFCEAEGFTPALPPGNFLVGSEVQFKRGLDGAGAHLAKFTYDPGGLVRLFGSRMEYANFVIWAQGEPDGLAIEPDIYAGSVPTGYRGVKQTALRNIHVHSAEERAFNFNAAVFGAVGIGLKAFLQGIDDGTGRHDDAYGFFIATENPRGTQTGHSASPAFTLIGPTVYGGDKAYYQRLGTCSLISPEFADCKQWLDLNTVWGHIAGPDFEFATRPSLFFNSHMVIDGGFSDTTRKDGALWPAENAPFGGQGKVFYRATGGSRVHFNRHRFGNHLGRDEGSTLVMNVALADATSRITLDDPVFHNASGAGFADKVIVLSNAPATRRPQRAGGARATFSFSRTFTSAPGATVPLYADGSGTRRLASRGGVIHSICLLEDGGSSQFTSGHNIVVRDTTGATRSTTAVNSLLAGSGTGTPRRADRTFTEIRFEAGDTISVEVVTPNSVVFPYTQSIVVEADYD